MRIFFSFLFHQVASLDFAKYYVRPSPSIYRRKPHRMSVTSRVGHLWIVFLDSSSSRFVHYNRHSAFGGNVFRDSPLGFVWTEKSETLVIKHTLRFVITFPSPSHDPIPYRVDICTHTCVLYIVIEGTHRVTALRIAWWYCLRFTNERNPRNSNMPSLLVHISFTGQVLCNRIQLTDFFLISERKKLNC